MVFARRSLTRATTVAQQSLRTPPIIRHSPILGRRFYASGKGGEEHKSSDLPWMLGSVGIGGPVIAYLLMSGPEKKPHGGDHGGHGAQKHEPGVEEKEESPPEPVEEESKEQPKEVPHEEPKEEKQTTEKKNGGPPSQEQKVGAEKTGHDEPAGMKPPAGPTSTSAKQEGVSNTNTMHPYINEEGKSQKGEGETETVKLKGTVKPERPQQ